MWEKIKGKKITLSIGSIVALSVFIWQANNYLNANFFEPIKQINNKLDKDTYEADKRQNELRDSIKQANERYLTEKENELINKYSSVKSDTTKITGGK